MITSTETVCVIIPIYKTQLSASEQLSLTRCIEVLGAHPIVMVTPESLAVDVFIERHPMLLRESFADAFFCDVKSYNRLLLSDCFYARFMKYEFILIYQLDAFVFSDQLLHWCSQGYDYVGAPWIPNNKPYTLKRRLRTSFHRRIYRWIDKKQNYGNIAHDGQLHYSAGNGGFSLRRISKMQAVLRILHTKADEYRSATRMPWGEDTFFSVEPNRYWNRLKIPEAKVAACFSWESNPMMAAQICKLDLPFGCHAWDSLHTEEWRPVFKQLGYDLELLLDENRE